MYNSAMKESKFIAGIQNLETAIRRKGEGAVARAYKDADLDKVGFSAFKGELEDATKMQELICSAESDAILPKKYFDVFVKHAQFCKVRPRPVETAFNGRSKDGSGKCSENALFLSEKTGMRLFSGYATFIGSKNAYWHVWNVDPQGYVYDSTYQELTYRAVYYGVEVDPYKAGQILQIYELPEGNLSEESLKDYNFMLYVAQGFYFLRQAVDVQKKLEEMLQKKIGQHIYEAALSFIQPGSTFDEHLFKGSSKQT